MKQKMKTSAMVGNEKNSFSNNKNIDQSSFTELPPINSAYLNISRCGWQNEWPASELSDNLLSVKSGRGLTTAIPTVTGNIDLQLKILNVWLYCHFTPKTSIYLFIYSLILRSSGYHLENPTAKTLSVVHKTLET